MLLCHTQSIADSNIWITFAFVARIGLPGSVYAALTYYMQRYLLHATLAYYLPKILSTGLLDEKDGLGSFLAGAASGSLGMTGRDAIQVHNVIGYMMIGGSLRQNRNGNALVLLVRPP